MVVFTSSSYRRICNCIGVGSLVSFILPKWLKKNRTPRMEPVHTRYFSETFRKEMGCSPADYRKWYRGLSEECPVAWTESKEESAKTAKNAKKRKVWQKCSFLFIVRDITGTTAYKNNTGNLRFFPVPLRSRSSGFHWLVWFFWKKWEKHLPSQPEPWSIHPGKYRKKAHKG